MRACILAVTLARAAHPILAQTDADPRGVQGITEVTLDGLSDKNISALGQSALSIHPDTWKHGESANFVYHFTHGFVATPVSVEAEYYYRVISRELEKDTSQWERKSHIYIFEKPEDWTAFQKLASLDPWTGGIHVKGDLFIQRNPEFRFKGRSLGHEITHLVVHRFFGSGCPLWLDEGYAEYASIRSYASYERARGSASRPQSMLLPSTYIPVETLTNFMAYPSDVLQVRTFYVESEKLVRFLAAESKPGFLAFLDGMCKGNRFETALWKGYGGRFAGTADLNSEFQRYATQHFAIPGQP